jgi:hypothetical protein
MDERASAPEICAYYARVLKERLLESGRVSFYPNCDYVGDGRFVSHVSGQHFQVHGRRRVVDAHYLSPMIPATSPPPFGVAEGVQVVPVNDLVNLGDAPSQYVIAGSGKTATDACIWLLENGVDPEAIVWVRARDPWMLNRAAVQPDPVVFLTTAAENMEAAEAASSPDHLFLLMEDAGLTMLRIDRSVTPTMAKIATLCPLGARPVAQHRAGRPARPHHAGRARPVGARRRRCRHRPGCCGRALRRSGVAVPPTCADLGTRDDHVAADPEHVRLLRSRTGGLRRSHPR